MRKNNTILYRRYLPIGTALLSLLIVACGGNPKAKKFLGKNYPVPAGVDSLVAREADSLNIFLFVGSDTEKKGENLKKKARERLQRSDSLWARVAQKTRVNAQDSIEATRTVEIGKNSLNKLAAAQEDVERNKIDADTFKRVEKYLDESINAFEQAILLNPYDLEARSWLARVYRIKAERFQSAKDYERAARALEDLLYLDKGNHMIYFQLAENYYNMNAWKLAYDIFVEAEKVLRETSFLAVNSTEASIHDLNRASVDTATMFYYRYYQGVTQARLYNADEALSILHSAKALAQTDDDRDRVQNYIDWINWDDGNIRASEIRDSLIVLQREGKFKQATDGFLRLVRYLRTQRTRDEIEWRAAVLEYQKLSKQDEAVRRLHALIERTAKNDLGAPLDTSYQHYFEDYSTMCYNLGLENARQSDWQKAYAYFLQASKIHWKGKGKCHVEIAKIVQNNPDLVIEHCKKAQEQENTLTNMERQQLYQLLSVAYLKKRMPEEAKRARHNWLMLQRGMSSNGS